jgi:hypothetical protein
MHQHQPRARPLDTQAAKQARPRSVPPSLYRAAAPTLAAGQSSAAPGAWLLCCLPSTRRCQEPLGEQEGRQRLSQPTKRIHVRTHHAAARAAAAAAKARNWRAGGFAGAAAAVQPSASRRSLRLFKHPSVSLHGSFGAAHCAAQPPAPSRQHRPHQLGNRWRGPSTGRWLSAVRATQKPCLPSTPSKPNKTGQATAQAQPNTSCLADCN